MPVSQIASDFFSFFKLAISLGSLEERRMKLGSPAKYFIFIVWCSACFVIGLLLFASGLLLHRNVLPNKSSCVDLVESCRNLKTLTALEKCLASHSARQIDEQICTESNFKIVLIIIDALRYDFVEYNEDSSDASFHTNKLVVVRDLLENEPNKSRLFKFMADPPTTTMQRILGLTTGSLPTFIDVGSNFASSEIDEDNIVDMLNRHGKNVVFLGDDTWTKLYPNRFIRSYPFDSFNVWDLDTVDYGIREHLFTELRKNDWNLLIAHFLGVDHCGHRYGPYHPEMKRKLEEMNEVLRSIVDHIKHKDDTLLFVIGDHGMTSTGDHGGDTENEISTALFAYSPVYDLFGHHLGSRVMRQVDMAPTLSSILGLPIPFSSVGSVILECFPITLVGSLSETVFQLWRNIEQITNYVVEYSLHNAQLRVTNKIDNTLLRFQILKEMKSSISSDITTFRHEYRAFMTDILAMCRDVWVQFDMVAIGCGLCFLLTTTSICYCICDSLSPTEVSLCRPEYTFVFVGKIFFLLSFAVIFVTHLFGANVDFRTLLAIALVCTFVLLWWCRQLCGPVQMKAAIGQRLTVFNVFTTVVLLVSLGGLFSNSFIIEEPSVILFLICSVLWVQLLFHRPPKMWTQVTLLLYTAVTHVVLRVAQEFLKCHEEQAHCQDIILKKYEIRLCAVSIVAVALLIGNWLRSRPPKFYAYVAVLCLLLLASYWICETCFEHLTLAQDIPVILLPLTICSIYHLLLTPRPKNIDNCLWSSFDATFSNVAVFLALLGCVVLGQTYAVPLVLMVVYCRALAVFLYSCCRYNNNKNSSQISWSDVILWSMSSIYWFYATGHYASFAGIQWNAAFLLQKEIGDKMLIPGILVMLNTFFSYVVHGITLPVLFLTQWAPFSKPILPVLSVNGIVTQKNEIHPHTLEYLYSGVFKLIMQYLTLFGLRLFFVTLSATILSRHLMMWKIFAPKFIFEAIAFMVSILSLLLGFVCVCRIGSEIQADTIVRSKRST